MDGGKKQVERQTLLTGLRTAIAVSHSQRRITEPTTDQSLSRD